MDIDALYFDFSKAFDTVSHKHLLSKLQSYKVSQQRIDWMKAYLSYRKQRVLVNGTRSDWEAVSSGVPQGRVLGRVLFLIYINDLPKSVKNCIRLFADDTKLYRTVMTDLDCLQQGIENIEEWANKWQLKSHPKKCKTMRIGDKYPKYNYTITAEDETLVHLEETDTEKYRPNRSSCGQQINIQPAHKQHCGESKPGDGCDPIHLQVGPTWTFRQIHLCTTFLHQE